MIFTNRPGLHIIFVALAALALFFTCAPWVEAQDGPVPAQPTGLSTAPTHNSVTLTWDNPGDDSITHYQVLRRDRDVHDTGEFVTIKSNTGSAATSYTDTSAQPQKRYVYRVKAVNAHGVSKWSTFRQGQHTGGSRAGTHSCVDGRANSRAEPTVVTAEPTAAPTQEPVVPTEPTRRRQNPQPRRRRSQQPCRRQNPQSCRRQNPQPRRRRSPQPCRRQNPQSCRRQNPQPRRRRAHSRADGRTHSRADGRTHSRADGRTHSRADAGAHSRADAGAHSRADGRTHSRADGRTHSRADPQPCRRQNPQPCRRQNPQPCRRQNPQPCRRQNPQPSHCRRRSRRRKLSLHSRSNPWPPAA